MPPFGSDPAGASLAEIEGLYRRRAAEYERVATAIVRDPDAARDVVQDAFVNLIRKRASFGRRGSLDAWAWKSVVNAALNRLRTTHRNPTNGLIEGVPERSASEPAASVDQRVLVSLMALPEKERLIVFLRYYADLDYDTIATALGISPGTVGSALYSAHRSLRVHLSTEVIQ